MKRYETPKVQVISRNTLDIICASELLYPMLPLSDDEEIPANGEQA